ncbi:MAG: outer membrane protein assembly factor BamC [Betaproteobacteria bacterium]|jgi:outer membrane protein assembly factor BamC|nr:outer membrane protein assembly factor BamC [Betaproteobacteria bacterium]
MNKWGVTRHVLIAALVPVVMVGCSWDSLFESKSIEYKSAGKLPPLEVPPDLTKPGSDNRYAVPDLPTSSTATYSQYNQERTGQVRPGRAEVLPTSDSVHLERAGSERWLVVKGDPDKIWPVVREFWQENGFLIRIDNPEAGVMETDWAENRAKIPDDIIRRTLGKMIDGMYSTGERDKFRTRMERGKTPGTVEIFITHRGMVEELTGSGVTKESDSSKWVPRPPDPALEAEFMSRLMVRLGVEEERANAMVASGRGVDRAKLVDNGKGDAGALELAEPFDRAWRRVGVALDRSGFTVEDRDRSKGLYFVRYIDPDVDGGTKGSEGLLSKLAFWRKDPGVDLSKLPQYQVQIKEAKDDSSEVKVLGKDGAPETSDTSRKILSLLYKQLK